MSVEEQEERSWNLIDVNIQNQEAPQVEGLWVPNTPLKPVLTTPVIYTDSQRNQQIPFGWLGSEGSSSVLTPANQIYGTGACFDSTNGDREATFGACHRFNNVDINGPCVYGHGTFQALLALAEGRDWIMSTQDRQRFLSEVISPFAPVTPEKKMTPEHKVGTEDEMRSEERKKQGNEIAILAVDVNRQQTDNEVQNQVNSSCPALVKEHHEPDKGSVHEIDLNKILQKRSRRKKHRPKVIAEGETKRTPKPTTPKHVGSKENPTVKRKYVRKNGLTKSSRSLPVEVPEDSAETKSSEPPKKSCRRALNFDGNEQRRGEYSKCSPNSQEPERVAECSGGENRSTLHLGGSIEVIVETTQAGVAYDLTLAVNQMLKDYSSLPQKQAPTAQFPVNLDKWRNPNPNPKENNTETQAHATGNDLPYTTSQAMLLASTQLTLVSPEGSQVGMTMTEGEQATGSKRKAVGSVEQPGSCSTSQTGIQYSALTAYQGVQFPAICKRKRTEKGQNSATSSTSSSFHAQDVVKCPQKTLEADPSKLKFSTWISPQHYNNALSNVPGEAGRGHRCNQPAVGCMLSHPERATKKRSRGPTRARDWASLTGFAGSTIHPSYVGRQVLVGFDRQVNSSRPHTCMEALTSQMSDTLTRKKRTKRVSLVNSAFSSTNEGQSYGQIILSNQNQFSTKSLGAPEEIWEYLIYLDDISGRLKHLDINSERNALVPYNMMNEKQKALVLYSGDGAIVPIRKRRPRPKVELDDETNKVWKLLMASINSAGINGTDEEKVRWWEEERRVFRGRVDSFIARMHLVQGDRRFSQWKGSVLDSVIGVFLTQNVSDHLSSSAFISLAARFPLKSKNKPMPCCGERTASVIEEPIVIIDPDDTTKWHEGTLNLSACDQSSTTLHETELNEEPEVVNSNGSPGSSTGIVCSETGPEMYYKSMVKTSTIEITETGDGCYIAEEKTQTYDANSSNDSVVSSQTSVGSPSTQSPDTAESTNACNKQRTSPLKTKESDTIEDNCSESRELKEMNAATRKAKSRRVGKEIREDVDWDALRKQAEENRNKRERTADTMDSMNYEAVRCAEVEEIADAIKERGMNNMLAERIKNFLNRLFKEHGSTNLEWLRDVPPEKAKEFLLSIIGLGLKSVECVRLLTLQHLAFPVDTNVGRIAVRLGWVPLQPLPESLQLHLLELYPVQESIQKYLWPRLCKLDQRTLYELHYQLITFGKVFCTKSKPNCNACPMRGECRHFASAFASARLALPGTEEKRLVSAPATKTPHQNPAVMVNQLPLPLPKVTKQSETNQQSVVNRQPEAESGSQNCEPIIEVCSARLALPGTEEKHSVSAPANKTTDQNHEVMGNQLPLPQPKVTKQSETNQQSVENRQSEAEFGSQNCKPIIEEPSTPEPEQVQETVHDIEDCFWEDPDEIPTIRLDIEEFTQNLQNYMQQNMEIQEGDLSRALVALTAEAASIPMPRLKNVSRLRTEHQVYGLPDNHPLLQGLERREPDDPSPYLLAIWSPGETAESVQPPERKCSSQEYGNLCNEKTCSYCNSAREADSKLVRGTLLIPCRTAMRGSFPLNGTYFQVNEVFADYDSSLNPIAVPRSWIWDLPRRTVHFGTSVPTIFRGMTTEEIQHCFWKGFVCVRAFDQKTRAPRPLIPRLHFPASKNKERGKGKEKARAE